MLVIDVLDDNSNENWSAAEMIEETRRIMEALNKTAGKAASEVALDLPRRFTMRNQWTRKGIRVERASTDDLAARVYSVDDYMVKQEEGQTWKPDGHVAIPKGARPTPRSLIPRSMFPKELRNRKDVFLGDFSKKKSWKLYPHKGIFQRVMNGKHLRILYLLRGEKITKPIWQFSDQVQDAVDMNFQRCYADLDDYRRREILTDIYLRQPSWMR